MKEKALDNKCPSCGALITFNIDKQLFHCEYCDNEFDLEDLKEVNLAQQHLTDLKTLLKFLVA